MDEQSKKTSKITVSNWRVSIIIGAVSIIIGLWCVFAPQLVLRVLYTVFALIFLLIGVFELWFALSNKEKLTNWQRGLYTGIIDILFGLVLLFFAKSLVNIVIIVVAVYVLIKSVWTIFLAMDLKKSGFEEWKNYIFTAIIGIVFSLIFIFNPNILSSTIAIIIGFALLIFGIFRIYYAMKMKGFQTFASEVKEKIEDLSEKDKESK